MSAINPKRRECRAGPLSMRRRESDTMFGSLILDTLARLRPDPLDGDRVHARDRQAQQTGRLQRADGRLTACAWPFHKHFDRAHPVLHRLARGRFSRDLRSVWGTLARTFETVLASARPADHIPRRIGDRHNRVVECALNMGLPPGHMLLFAALPPLPLLCAGCAALRLLFCHYSSVETFHVETLNVRTLLLGCLLLDTDRLPAASTAGARVGTRALPAHGQTLAMSQATITADVHQPLDVQLDLAAQIAFDAIFALHDLADAPDLLLGQVAHSDVRVDVGFFENVKPIRAADTKDIGDRNLDFLVTRDLNPSNTCHTALFLSGLCLGWRLQMTRMIP